MEVLVGCSPVNVDVCVSTASSLCSTVCSRLHDAHLLVFKSRPTRLPGQSAWPCVGVLKALTCTSVLFLTCVCVRRPVCWRRGERLSARFRLLTVKWELLLCPERCRLHKELQQGRARQRIADEELMYSSGPDAWDTRPLPVRDDFRRSSHACCCCMLSVSKEDNKMLILVQKARDYS